MAVDKKKLNNRYEKIFKNNAMSTHAKPKNNSQIFAQRLRRLKEHMRQIQTLEVVLTVVGTMKAGKSTCINAIVGREILPNRNRPMTTLPTLVKHRKGFHTPVLHFPNMEPVQRLANKLATALKRVSLVRSNLIASDAELTRLAKIIRRGFKMKNLYRGEREVMSFLRNLNDLARLAAVFNIDFPFDAYQELEELPMIEVEFLHLSQYDHLDDRGSIALMDTPGFNEAGVNQHLKKMLKMQLERANAILVVLDYTQLKSESESDLIQELYSVGAQVDGRIFSLVNKFDERNRNSDDAQETVRYVSHSLLNDLVSAEHIFPVSAQSAYLVQRAQDYIERQGSLQWKESKTKDWRDDFGSLAFGRRYEKFINDNQAVLEACQALWEESGMDAALEKIIVHCQKETVKFALNSAIDRLQGLQEILKEPRGFHY